MPNLMVLPEFPSPFEYIDNEPMTLVELRMRKFSGEIREQPHWWEKVRDIDVVAKWKNEIIEQDEKAVEQFWGGQKKFDAGNGEKKWPHENITGAQLNFIFAELRYLSQQIDRETGIQSTAIDNIYQSMSLIPPDLKAVFLSNMSILESVPPEEQDWHPGANDQVLDLVHPSLYCVHIGISSVFKSEKTSGDPLHVPDEGYYHALHDLESASTVDFLSNGYQWLPTDFKVSTTGEVRPLGYINNLHPIAHKRLYSNLTSILQYFIPLFQHALSDLSGPRRRLAIEVDPSKWYENRLDWDLSSEEGEAESTQCDWPLISDPLPFSPPRKPTPISLKGRRLQVIIKLVNVVLTPERPHYPGGSSWHVEGRLNEKIVATGIYYYASDNVSQSKLAFRAAVGDGTEDCNISWNYEDDDSKGWTVAFGLPWDRGMNQELGSIAVTEDKCLVFPNIYQRRAAPFELTDPTKPGSLKILFFFLVDPAWTIISTSDVPPQQRSWYLDELEKVPALRALPQEIWDMIVNDALAGTITLEEAKKERLALMKERSDFVIEHNRQRFEMEFNDV